MLFLVATKQKFTMPLGDGISCKLPDKPDYVDEKERFVGYKFEGAVRNALWKALPKLGLGDDVSDHLISIIDKWFSRCQATDIFLYKAEDERAYWARPKSEWFQVRDFTSCRARMRRYNKVESAYFKLWGIGIAMLLMFGPGFWLFDKLIPEDPPILSELFTLKTWLYTFSSWTLGARAIAWKGRQLFLLD